MKISKISNIYIYVLIFAHRIFVSDFSFFLLTFLLTYLIGFHSSKNQIRKFWTRYKKINFLPFFFKLHSHLFFLNDSFFPASLCLITFMLHVRAYINVKDRVRVNKRAYRNSRVRRTRMRVNRQCTLMFSRVLYFSGLLKRRTFNISLLFSYFAYLLCTGMTVLWNIARWILTRYY